MEDIFLSLSDPIDFEESLVFDLATLRKPFKKFRDVKVLRLHRGLETQVADMF